MCPPGSGMSRGPRRIRSPSPSVWPPPPPWICSTRFGRTSLNPRCGVSGSRRLGRSQTSQPHSRRNRRAFSAIHRCSNEPSTRSGGHTHGDLVQRHLTLPTPSSDANANVRRSRLRTAVPPEEAHRAPENHESSSNAEARSLFSMGSANRAVGRARAWLRSCRVALRARAQDGLRYLDRSVRRRRLRCPGGDEGHGGGHEGTPRAPLASISTT
jgi:hypothetical protein